ncbi:alpha/beta hydrolase [Flavihumibacter solisilvae]|uniref:alpha/beta hydrolase n=1 Tax=Flavihumibacter solisilvae TaxID=1349421 RepID=UPI00068A1D9A|nr:alpha/beta hydrolase-fold protein [Flavihumibacter solisilvae]
MTEQICPEKTSTLTTQQFEIKSDHLERQVTISTWTPKQLSSYELPALLLINDGQQMESLGLTDILEDNIQRLTKKIITVAIHAGPERKQEYGTAGVLDYLGQGSKAMAYTLFIFEELLPFVRRQLGYEQFSEKIFAGFSLGGLSALDIVWAHPHEFSAVGVFSGSLWWRTIDQDDPAYSDDQHRIMHQLIRKGNYASWLKFFFSTGTMDETHDRNNNGIIDSIDDTLDLMKELTAKGYDQHHDMKYLELSDGKHDIATWARAMPAFLEWTMITR